MLKDNWLNTVSSGTYKFTFYIVDSEVFNDPFAWLSQSDDAALNAGKAVIIAEDGVEAGYAVQNVMIKSNTGSVQNGYANVTQITFDLIEPLGFSLLDRILTIGSYLNKSTDGGVNFESMLYVLKLDFVGRDPITGATKNYPEPFLYTGKIRGITGSLGNAGAKYFVDFAPHIIMAQLETVTTSTITVEDVTTVETFLNGLEVSLNDASWAAMDERQDSPLVLYKVNFDSSMSIAAQDALLLPAFDLKSAPWGGTANSGEAGGQGETLDKLGVRTVTINTETQLTAAIKNLIAANTTTFAEFSKVAREAGVTYAIEVEPSVEMLGIMCPIYNLERRMITLNVRTKLHGDSTPIKKDSITQLRNTATVQERRFDELVLPGLIKKYSYQYSGENLEVMDIDLTLKNLFFNALSPMGGIYYADNNNMFEANIEPEKENTDDTDDTANPQSARSAAPVKYLSDLTLQKYNINQSPVFREQTVGAAGQQVNETTSTDKIAAASMDAHASRIADAQMLSLEVRGDPVFMGNNNTNLFNSASHAIYMAFINFQPNADDLLLRQMRGPVDMITTGIYKITEVESKFQQGSFTQRVSSLRDANSSSFLLLDTLINLEVE